MKVLGLIVEYNPFHNGHFYHLEESRKHHNADFVVCVMSGNFVQRGEVAIINKWARAKTALLCGADLVIELPAVYAMSSAEYFAFGAISLLDSLNLIDFICFGSESGNIEELNLIAEVLNEEPDLYKHTLKENLNKGLSYPTSREKAINKFLNISQGVTGDGSLTRNLQNSVSKNRPLSHSNNILGIEYLKALKKIKSKIIPFTINRIISNYNSEEMTGSISSASAIRRCIFDNYKSLSTNSLETALPAQSLSIIKQEFEAGRGPVFSDFFESIILSSIRKMDREQIRELPYIAEGMENRIKEAANNSGTLEELIEKICTKRYTKTRIQRALFSILTGLNSKELDLFTNFGGPQYIRVLGFNSKGKSLLAEINKKATLPVIVKTADFKNSCNPLLKRMLEIEAASTDTYVLGYQNPEFRKAGQEFTQNIIRL